MESRPYHFSRWELNGSVPNSPHQNLEFGRITLPDALVWYWQGTHLNEVKAIGAFNKNGDQVLVLSNDSPQSVKLDLQELLRMVASRIGSKETSLRVSPKKQFGFLVRKPDLIRLTLVGENSEAIEVYGLMKVYRNHAVAVVGFDNTADPSLIQDFLDSYEKTTKRNSSTLQAILTLWIGLMVLGVATIYNGISKESTINGSLWALVFVVASMGVDLWKYPAYGDPQRLSELFFAYAFIFVLFVHFAVSWHKRQQAHLKQQEYCFHENLQGGTSVPNRSQSEGLAQSSDSPDSSVNQPST